MTYHSSDKVRLRKAKMILLIVNIPKNHVNHGNQANQGSDI
jgi:hypothetical protein